MQDKCIKTHTNDFKLARTLKNELYENHFDLLKITFSNPKKIQQKSLSI